MNNTTRTILGVFVGLILLAGAFSGGFIAGHLMPGTGQLPVLSDFLPGAPGVEPEQQAATPDGLETLFAPFWEAWNVVHDQYVEQPVDDQLLMQGAIRGMMDASQHAVALERPVGDDGDTEFGDFIEDQETLSPVDAAIQQLSHRRTPVGDRNDLHAGDSLR